MPGITEAAEALTTADFADLDPEFLDEISGGQIRPVRPTGYCQVCGITQCITIRD